MTSRASNPKPSSGNRDDVGVSKKDLTKFDDMMWGEVDLDDVISGKVTANRRGSAESVSRRDSTKSMSKSRRSSEN